MEAGWDIAQICLNGHVINGMSQRFPSSNQTFCDRCGEQTIRTCPKCDHSIKGKFYSPGGFANTVYKAPGYCMNCGVPFPWTQRRIQQAVDLATEIGGLSGDDAAQFEISTREITKDTPQTELAAHRIKKLLVKVGHGAAKSIRGILIEVASETAKKIIVDQA